MRESGISRKLITIVTPCYNEELNVRELHRRVLAIAASLPEYRMEHLFIDNATKDSTVRYCANWPPRTLTSRSLSTREISARFAHRCMRSYRPRETRSGFCAPTFRIPRSYLLI